jgi:Flp pilus assembly pilin Flp
MPRKNKGQSILEYILVLSAVVGCILWAANSIIKTKVQGQFTDASTLLTTVAGKLP